MEDFGGGLPKSPMPARGGCPVAVRPSISWLWETRGYAYGQGVMFDMWVFLEGTVLGLLLVFVDDHHTASCLGAASGMGLFSY